MHFLRWGSQSWGWMPCSSSLSFPRTWRGSIRLPRALKPMAPRTRKLDGTSPQRAWAEICPEARRPNKLGYFTNTKDKPKVQLPTRVAPNEENHQMLETKKVTLCHKGKSCLCRGRNARWWLCATKANHDCAVDGMLKGGLVLPRQIMIVPRTKH